MHRAIEAARKTAGIGSLAKNYPEDPHERGAGHWAAFIGSLNAQLMEMDARRNAADREIERLASRNAELRRELREATCNENALPDVPARCGV